MKTQRKRIAALLASFMLIGLLAGVGCSSSDSSSSNGSSSNGGSSDTNGSSNTGGGGGEISYTLISKAQLISSYNSYIGQYIQFNDVPTAVTASYAMVDSIRFEPEDLSTLAPLMGGCGTVMFKGKVTSYSDGVILMTQCLFDILGDDG